MYIDSCADFFIIKLICVHNKSKPNNRPIIKENNLLGTNFGNGINF